ncbi:MAG TPA: hypothetical protein VLJ68_07800, partial [Chitinophagaceae bacterium]|nr:hypothetical protein [Chitinophagaceae bacterium]
TEDTATLWETKSWKPLVQMAMGRSNFDCAFSENAERLMMWDGRDIVLWSIPDGKKLSEIRNPFRGRISQPYISGDGSKIGLVSRNGIYIWDVITKKNISKVSRGFSYQWEELAFSYTGTYFIVAQKDSLLLMRSDGTTAGRIGRPSSNTSTAQFSKDDKYILAGTFIYDIANDKWVEKAEQAGKNYQQTNVEQALFQITLTDTTTSQESGARIMEKSSGHFFQLLPLAGRNYMIYDESGRYDGSAEVLSQITLACEDKIITDKKEIEKLYVPGLAEKIMRNRPIKAMKIAELNICK